GAVLDAREIGERDARLLRELLARHEALPARRAHPAREQRVQLGFRRGRREADARAVLRTGARGAGRPPADARRLFALPCHVIPAPRSGYFGGMRSAPSSRMVSPFSISFSTMCCASCAYSSGRPRREGNGT